MPDRSSRFKSLVIEYRAATTAALVAGLVAVGVAGGVASRDEVSMRQTSSTDDASTTTTEPASTSTTTVSDEPTIEEVPARVVVIERDVRELDDRVTALESTTTTTAPPIASKFVTGISAIRSDPETLHVTWVPLAEAATYDVKGVAVPAKNCCTIAVPAPVAADGRVQLTVTAFDAAGHPSQPYGHTYREENGNVTGITADLVIDEARRHRTGEREIVVTIDVDKPIYDAVIVLVRTVEYGTATDPPTEMPQEHHVRFDGVTTGTRTETHVTIANIFEQEVEIVGWLIEDENCPCAGPWNPAP